MPFGHAQNTGERVVVFLTLCELPSTKFSPQEQVAICLFSDRFLLSLGGKSPTELESPNWGIDFQEGTQIRQFHQNIKFCGAQASVQQITVDMTANSM